MENKKCPLCGKPGEQLGNLTGFFVGCSGYRDGCDVGTGIYRTEAEAWQAWNTRPEEDRLNAEVERLKDAFASVLYGIDNCLEDDYVKREALKTLRTFVKAFID